jgi:hypothetical protein
MIRVGRVLTAISWVSHEVVARIFSLVRSRGFLQAGGQVALSTNGLENAKTMRDDLAFTRPRMGCRDLETTMNVVATSWNNEQQKTVGPLPFVIHEGDIVIKGNAVGDAILSPGANLNFTNQSSGKCEIGTRGRVMLQESLDHRLDGSVLSTGGRDVSRGETVGANRVALVALNNTQKGCSIDQAILLDAVSSDERTTVARAAEIARVKSLLNTSAGLAIESASVASLAVVDNTITAPVVAPSGNSTASGGAGESTSIKTLRLAGGAESGAIALLTRIDVTIAAPVAV